MISRRSFKSDVSFLEKISMGAIGTRQVFADLVNQGHNPIELERGSMSFKIWKQIKIKRIRVPDVLCVGCGRRIESRAKTSFEISMSHSFSDPERGWDYGLDDDDFVTVVACKRFGERPIDWQASGLVQYIPVREMRTAQADGRIVFVRPKGAEEGFEARITWPAAIARAAGVVVSITENLVRYRRGTDSKMIGLKLVKQGTTLNPVVAEGEPIVENEVLAAVVPVVKVFPCPQSASEGHYIDRLSSPSLSTRYTAAKALSFFQSADASTALLQRINESAEHIYVRLESAASLARHEDERGWAFITQCLADTYLQNRLEAVIILGEITAEVSSLLLTNVVQDESQHPEIRAGAAWALGELHDSSSLTILIESFTNVEETLRIEAARSLAKLASSYATEIVHEFRLSSPDKRPGIAWALSTSGKFSLEDMLDGLVDDDARHWVTYILGSQDQQLYVHGIERLKERDPEVYFAVTVLWKIMTSWVYKLEEY